MIEIKGLTTVYGPGASGKTTLCLMKANEESFKNKIIYLDTENGFNLDRLKQMNNNIDKNLDNIIRLKASNFKDQQEKIKMLFNLVKESKASLLIVDSIGIHYRKLVRNHSSLANSMLISQVRILKDISKYIPVLVTNQVYSDMNDGVKMLGGKILKDSYQLIELIKNNKRKCVIWKPIKEEFYFDIDDKGLRRI